MKIKVIISILLAATLALPLAAQSRAQLEAKRKKMQEDIAYTRNILKKTSAKKSAALHNLNTLNVIISKRNAVIDDLKNELTETEKEIFQRNLKLGDLQKQFELEKFRMRKTIAKAYKTRKSANELAFVFASSSFRQALRRLKYLKKLSEYRSFLIARIEESKDSVKAGLTALEKTKADKKVIIQDEVSEKNNLEKDKKEKATVVKLLAGEEKQLKKKIRNNEVAIAKLNSSISRLIAVEIEAARKKAVAAAAKSSSGSNTGKTSKTDSKTEKGSSKSSESKVTLTPEARELSNSFAANTGALPWPVEKGYISQSFGVHAHPDLSGITMINNGIDITTTEGSKARSVFKGKVSAIINIPGQEKAVLVNHGEYFTVYSRLTEVYVKRGDEVTAKQNLGVVWTDEDGKTILQFQVWKGQVKQNPSSWLLAK